MPWAMSFWPFRPSIEQIIVWYIIIMFLTGKPVPWFRDVVWRCRDSRRQLFPSSHRPKLGLWFCVVKSKGVDWNHSLCISWESSWREWGPKCSPTDDAQFQGLIKVKQMITNINYHNIWYFHKGEGDIQKPPCWINTVVLWVRISRSHLFNYSFRKHKAEVAIYHPSLPVFR